jgi:hypothetical protein
MDGRIFARFHLDAGIGDAVMQPVEMIECRDWLACAGIASPLVQHFGQGPNSEPVRGGHLFRRNRFPPMLLAIHLPGVPL